MLVNRAGLLLVSISLAVGMSFSWMSGRAITLLKALAKRSAIGAGRPLGPNTPFQ